MAKNADELNRWHTRVQRKLEGMPLTKLDREELEEMLAIIVNLAQRQMVAAETQAAAETSSRRAKKDGGES